MEADTEGGELSRIDKVAAVAAVAMAAGYVVTPIQTTVAAVLSLLLDPLTMVVPFSAVLSGIGGGTGVVTTVLVERLRDDDRVERLQERMEDLQDRMGDDPGSTPDGVEEELLGTWGAMMKAKLRPMIWSMLVTVPAFLYLRWAFAAPAAAAVPAVTVLPVLGPVTLTATLVGPLKVWVVWYLGASMSARLVTKRVLARLDPA